MATTPMRADGVDAFDTGAFDLDLDYQEIADFFSMPSPHMNRGQRRSGWSVTATPTVRVHVHTRVPPTPPHVLVQRLAPSFVSPARGAHFPPMLSPMSPFGRGFLSPKLHGFFDVDGRPDLK